MKMNDGRSIPILGLGTYLTTGGSVIAAVQAALEAGYRHFDTADLYDNEKAIGTAIRDAIRNTGLEREELFITTKLWNSDHGYDSTIEACNRSLEKLGLDYVDLYLIHWPVEDLRGDSWRALEHLKDDGKCRSIGVSNYMSWHLEELLGRSDTVPAVNQFEFHPYLYPKELLEICAKNDIVVEAYSPLTKGEMLDDPDLIEVAEKYGKSAAQMLIRWAIQHGTVVLPKSSDPVRIKENADVFDFTISQHDMQHLDSFNTGLRVSWDPSTVP